MVQLSKSASWVRNHVLVTAEREKTTLPSLVRRPSDNTERLSRTINSIHYVIQFGVGIRWRVTLLKDRWMVRSVTAVEFS